MTVNLIPTTLRMFSYGIVTKSSFDPCIRCFHKSNRNLFDFSTITEMKKRRHFKGKQLVGYSMDQMFQVVSDVENYFKFVPFCKKSMVYDKKPLTFKADLVIGFPPLNERYTSHVVMSKPDLVKAECHEGRLFSYLLNYWKFSPGVKDVPQSCVIDFEVSFEFKSAIHSQLANFFFDQLVLEMEKAFIDEAQQRFGRPAIKSRRLEASSSMT